MKADSLTEVYPRVCGGSGLLPRTGGRCRGLSPRVRGKLAEMVAGLKLMGSIPACAGEADGGCPVGLGLAVYPRVCGGSETLGYGKHTLRGLSPRVRGKHWL